MVGYYQIFWRWFRKVLDEMEDFCMSSNQIISEFAYGEVPMLAMLVIFEIQKIKFI